jgi:hypothetical protein
MERKGDLYRLHALQLKGGGVHIVKWIGTVTHDEVLEYLVLPAPDIVSQETT